jgi:hypothetical protein
MSRYANRRARSAVALFEITLAVIFASRVDAEVPPVWPAPGPANFVQPQQPVVGRPYPSPVNVPPPVNVGEARLDAMGPTDNCAEMRPVTAINTNIGIKPAGNERPEDVGAVCHPAQHEPLYMMSGRPWSPVCYFWEAPVLAYGPLYFEETNLERHGYSQTYLRGVQPLVSSAHFFGTVVATPFLLLAEPLQECDYTLGQYRPGDCVPFQWNYPYFSPCEGRHEEKP